MLNQTRNSFFESICKTMEKDADIVVVSADLAGPPFDELRAKYPDRYIPVGIAEQNSISIACGLALAGKKAIAYSANPFPLLRAFDQIRNGVCMMNIPLAIVGIGTGYSTAEYGSTHFTVEDIALASICQGLDIYSISDNEMAADSVNVFLNQSRPAYYRFGKWAGESLASEVDWTKGYRKVYGNGPVALVATGCTVGLLKFMQFDAQEFTIFDWFKLSDASGIMAEASKYDAVITVEEQIRRAGIGSILLEAFNDNGIDNKITRLGISMEKGYPQVYGSREYWLDANGITKDNILKRAEKRRESS